MTNNVSDLQKIIISAKLTALNKSKAFNIAYLLMEGQEFHHDDYLSKRAGYDVYYCDETGEWISDLEDRLECNFSNNSSKNIWIA